MARKARSRCASCSSWTTYLQARRWSASASWASEQRNSGVRSLGRERRSRMRNVVAGLLISLDGLTQSPNKWQFDHFDAEMMTAMTSHIAADDTVLLGRVTYQDWAAYSPTSTDEPHSRRLSHTV